MNLNQTNMPISPSSPSVLQRSVNSVAMLYLFVSIKKKIMLSEQCVTILELQTAELLFNAKLTWNDYQVLVNSQQRNILKYSPLTLVAYEVSLGNLTCASKTFQPLFLFDIFHQVTIWPFLSRPHQPTMDIHQLQVKSLKVYKTIIQMTG